MVVVGHKNNFSLLAAPPRQTQWQYRGAQPTKLPWQYLVWRQ